MGTGQNNQPPRMGGSVNFHCVVAQVGRSQRGYRGVSDGRPRGPPHRRS